jgi:hypothetical protein
MINKFKMFLSTPKGWLILTAVISLVYYLLTKHNQHFFEYLPFAILLLCPVMHLFMHGGHQHHNKDKKDNK